MAAPQRPMRRAPQMRKTMPSRAAQVQRRAADAIHPASGQAAIRPTLPGQTGHGQAAPGSLRTRPGNRLPPASARPPPAQHLSYPLPAEPPRNIPPTLVRQAPGRPRRTFETPVSARTFARLPPMSAFSRPPADEQTTTRKSAVRRPRNIPHLRLPRHPATRTIPPPHFFPPASVPTPPRRPTSLPERLSEATFIRVRSAGLQFSARPRSSRAQLPPCFRSPRGFRLLPRALLSPCSPRSIPRVFPAPFPAPSPHFCRTPSRLFAPHL